jgi:flagellar motility protein MotE (MotC chaperone)
MIRILQSSWVTALIGCLTYLGVTAALLSPVKFEGALAAAQHAEEKHISPNDDPSWRFRNPEMEQWMTELKREKEALEIRAQQLQELALRLESERKEMAVVTQTVSQLQAEFDKNVLRVGEQEIDNLKRQAKIFGSMSPEAVAALINEMQEDEAVKILFVMKNDDVGAILETLGKMGRAESKRAATITEKIRRVLPPDAQARPRTS